MKRDALQYLAEMGEICGQPVREGSRVLSCVRRPAHRGACNPSWQKRKLTREQRLARDVATLKAQRDRRTRHRDHLRAHVRALTAQRDQARGYLGYRIEYRILGYWRRWRRYGRFVWHRTVGRALGTWPPS